MMGISFLHAMVMVNLSVFMNFSHGVLRTADLYKQLDDHGQDGGDYCSNERHTIESKQFRLRLPQMDGKKVGYTQELELIKGTKHFMKTLSLDPPIFEIADFFSDDECDMVIDLALEKGMRKSSRDLQLLEKVNSEEETFEKLDLNKDGFIDKEEALSLPGTKNIYLTEEDTLEMFESLGMDQDKDGRISLTELKKTTVERVESYLDNQQVLKPRLRSQSNSQQVWLWHDDDELLQFEDLLEDYHDRISQLTALPKQIIDQSEPVQVVRYQENGHYHCHHDSEPATPNKPCCLYGSRDCRLCRYLTIMVFLNDVEDGGESAFPIADNLTFNWEAWSKDSKRICNLAKHCDKSNVVVQPHKGKALMWYNHLLDENNAWLRDVNPLSYQGSCPVRKGDKWVANIWININGDGQQELRAWKMGNNWLADKHHNQEVIDALRAKDAKDVTECKQYTKEGNTVENGEERASKIHNMKSTELKDKDKLKDNSEDSSTNSVSINKKKLRQNHEPEAFVETLEEIDQVPKAPKLSVTESSSPLPLTEEQMTPQGPPVAHLLPARYEGNRIMQSIMLLLEELDQVELEIVARNLHTKLKLVCVPLIMNPMGSI